MLLRPTGFLKKAAAGGGTPTLSNADLDPSGVGYLHAQVDTTEGNGTMHFYLSTSATPPSTANHKNGTGATAYLTEAVSASGTIVADPAFSGLSDNTLYYCHILHEGTGGDSSVSTVSATTFNAPGFTDSFTDTNGTGWRNRTGWTVVSGSVDDAFEIQSNQLESRNHANRNNWQTVGVTDTDQYVQATLVQVGATGWFAPVLRRNGSGNDNMYYCRINTGDTQIGSYLSGASSTLATLGTISAGAVVTFKVVGTSSPVLSVYTDGVRLGTHTDTDNDHTSGNAGGWGNTSNNAGAKWQYDDYKAGGV